LVTTPSDPLALLRSKSYLALLVLAATIGVPVSAAAYFFLALVSKLQGWVFTSLPKALGFHGEPMWWPVPPLLLAGVLVASTIRYLPGTGGRSPADGFKAGEGPPPAIDLPGIVLAAFTTLSLGVVLGPEGPLVALGSGLGALAVRLVKRDAPPRVQSVLAAAGSFAAISTLLGSPLTGAFLLMEASGLGGAMMQLVLVPGLLAAGVGSLMFVGLDAWTGLGTFSLAIPGLPHVGAPTGGESDGSPCSYGPIPSGGSCRSPRRPVWRSRAWRSRSTQPPARAPPRCCSPDSPHSARSSPTAPATASERCCCSSSAKGSPTECR
jgi:H+/Cl- antiporter ClcA